MPSDGGGPEDYGKLRQLGKRKLKRYEKKTIRRLSEPFKKVLSPKPFHRVLAGKM